MKHGLEFNVYPVKEKAKKKKEEDDILVEFENEILAIIDEPKPLSIIFSFFDDRYYVTRLKGNRKGGFQIDADGGAFLPGWSRHFFLKTLFTVTRILE